MIMEEASRQLSRRDLSEKEMREKLRPYGEETDEAIEKLKKAGYLNDEKLCEEEFIRQYGKKPLGVIIEKLKRRGISEELIEAQIPDDWQEREKRLAREVIRAKKKNGAAAWRYLMMRGFDAETIESLAE